MIDPITQHILEQDEILNESFMMIPLDIWQAIKQNKQLQNQLAKNKIIGAGILLGLATTVAAGVYKKYFTKAAKACKGSQDKRACLNKFKNDAIKEKIKSYEKSKQACSKTKDPAACKAQIQKKIQKEKSRIK